MTTRLRKGFRYLAGSEDDGEPAAGIDDEEQEKLIRDLAAHDLATTAIYRASTRYSSEHSLRDGMTDRVSPESLPCLSPFSTGLLRFSLYFYTSCPRCYETTNLPCAVHILGPRIFIHRVQRTTTPKPYRRREEQLYPWDIKACVG